MINRSKLNSSETADPRYASSPRLTVLHNLRYDDGLELVFSQFSDAFAFSASGMWQFAHSTKTFLTLHC